MGRMMGFSVTGLAVLLALAAAPAAADADLVERYVPPAPPPVEDCVWAGEAIEYDFSDCRDCYDAYEPHRAYRPRHRYQRPYRRIATSHPPQYGHHSRWSRYDYAGHCSAYGCRRTYDDLPHTHVYNGPPPHDHYR